MLFGQNAKFWKNYAGMIFGKAGSRVTVPDSFLVSNRLTCCGGRGSYASTEDYQDTADCLLYIRLGTH